MRRDSQAICAPMNTKVAAVKTKYFEVDPGALAGIEGDHEIENAEKAVEHDPHPVEPPPHPALTCTSPGSAALNRRCARVRLPIQKLPRKATLASQKNTVGFHWMKR
jgi:hypothetical protein